MLDNKKILITGIANKFSIATGIAKVMKRFGASLAITYQNKRLLRKVSSIAEELEIDTLIECYVSSD